MDSKESEEIRSVLNDVLIKNGEADRLKDMLTKLLIECGWKEEVNLMCRKVIHERGVDHITTDDLVREITPQARAKVPAEVKQLLLEKIRTVLMKELEDRERENGTAREISN